MGLIKSPSSNVGNSLCELSYNPANLKYFTAKCTSNTYDTFTDQTDTQYQVPVGKKLIILKVWGRTVATTALAFEIGSGTAAVSTGAAPAGAQSTGNFPFVGTIKSTAWQVVYYVYIVIAPSRYPFIRSETDAGPTLDVGIMAIEVDA